MLIPRTIGVFRHPLYRIAASNSGAARLCTSRQSQNIKKPAESPVEDKPPFPFMSQKYTQDNYDSIETFRVKETETWKYQPYIVMICMTVFMGYFFLLREEHDFDDRIAEAMYIAMPELEAIDLKKKIKYYKKLGLYSQHLEDRLAKLTKAKSK